jgi:hypothetical protein
MDVSEVKWKASADFQQAVNAFTQLEASQEKVITTAPKVQSALNSTSKMMSNSGQVGMQFNRIIQDSPFFLSNFSMGIMSIQNNLPVFIESIKYATATGATFKTMLAGMFTGMGGILTIVSIATAGITAFALANRGGAKDAKDHAKAVDDITEAYRKLSRVRLTTEVSLRQSESDLAKADLDARKKEIESKMKAPYTIGGGTKEGELTYLLQQDSRYQKLLATYKESLSALSLVKGVKEDIGDVENQRLILDEKTIAFEKAKGVIARENAKREMDDAKKTLDLMEGKKEKKGKEKVIFGAEEMLPQEYTKYLEAFFDSSKRMTTEKFDYEAQKLRDKYNLDLQWFADNEDLKRQAAETLEDGLTALRKKLSDDTWAYDLENYRKSIKKRLGITTPLELEKSDIPGISKPSTNWLTDEEQKNKLLQEQRKQYKAITIIADSASGAIGNTFKKMWSSVFGEADNLFADFMSRIASGFIDLAANAISGGIFGGIKDALGLSVVAGGSTPGVVNSSPIVIPIQLGDQTLSTVVAYGYNKAQRLRY